MQEILDFLQSLDWSPLVISIKTGIVATILSFFFGIFAARAVMKLRPGARAVIDGFLTLPMILPPTVAGFFLLLIFSLRRPFGAALYENFSIKAVQTWLGCILAATIIAFPLMYRNTRAAFEQVDTNLICGADAWYVGVEDFLESGHPIGRSRRALRYGAGICKGAR